MDCVVVYGRPTHARGLMRGITRRMAVQAASEPSSRPLDPETARAPCLRDWLRDLPAAEGRHAVAFDTRRDRAALGARVAELHAGDPRR